MLLSCSAAPTALQGHVRVFPAEQESSVNTGRILRCKHPIKAGCVPIYFKRRIIQGKYFDRFLLWLIKAKMHFIYDLGGSKL